MNEEFNPEEPNAVWCSDSTYIWTYEGFVYLTSIMDLYSIKIISWELSTTLEAKWVIEAINKAKATKNITRPLIMYSDRGIQYTCSSYQHAYRLVFNYIDAFYNTVRIHSHCGYLSPNQYEANYETELVNLYKNVS